MKKFLISDYIVDFFIQKGVKDVFGYQGGMIAFLFDSLKKYEEKIKYHISYNEQGAAFMAIGNALVTGNIGVCAVTSGPGFTNALTGIANAYCDSIPSIFIAAQVNYKDKKHNLLLRQKGFQEIPMSEVAKPVCKKSYNINKADEIVSALEEAYEISINGRKGPVFLDIPINVFYEHIDIDDVPKTQKRNSNFSQNFTSAFDIINKSRKPIIIAGAGIKQANATSLFRKVISENTIPVVTSMLAIDVLCSNDKHMLGFIGPDGNRAANYLVDKSDCIISLGARLDPRQTGYNTDVFAPYAQLIRIDLDENEFIRVVKHDSLNIKCDLVDFISKFKIGKKDEHAEWLKKCCNVKEILNKFDITIVNSFISNISKLFPSDSAIFLDVGKNQLWAAQSLDIKEQTKVFLSGGFACMGFSLPSAIGACFETMKPVYTINGDGGIQMNIQELQTIVQNKLPVKIIVINNHALGNVVIFQDRWLNSRYVATTEENGDYQSANICKIAEAYGIKSKKINTLNEIMLCYEDLIDHEPFLLEFSVSSHTPVLPDIPADKDALRSDDRLDKSLIEQIETMITY